MKISPNQKKLIIAFLTLLAVLLALFVFDLLKYKTRFNELKNDEIIELEMENERFRLEAEIDYKSCVTNLKNYLQEYKRVYKIRF